jgi:hypothetical protein
MTFISYEAMLTWLPKINNMVAIPNNRKGTSDMAKKSITISGVTMAILAIIAGIFVILRLFSNSLQRHHGIKVAIESQSYYTEEKPWRLLWQRQDVKRPLWTPFSAIFSTGRR